MSDFESFGPIESGEGVGASSEVTSEQREQIREQFKKAQQQLKKARKDEKKTKKREQTLVRIISKFVKSEPDPQILNTVLSLLKQNVTAEFIMGILSLYYPNIKQAIYYDEEEAKEENPLMLKETNEMAETLQPDVIEQEKKAFDENNLPEVVKEDINTWVKDIMYTAFLHPQWLLPKVIHKQEVNSTAIQLGAFILERYLDTKHIVAGDFEKIRNFSHYIISGVVREVQNHVVHAKRIEE